MSPITPESIPDVADVRQGLAERFERWRVPILAGVAVAVLASVGLLAWISVRRDREDTLRTELHSITDDFQGNRTLYSLDDGQQPHANREVAEDQAKKLEELRARAAGTPVEPQALLHLALRRQILGEDDRVLAILEEIRTNFPDSPVLRIQSFDTDRASLVDRIAGISRRRREFAAQHKFLEPKGDTSVVALVETDLGNMRIVFFTDLAPKHADAFVLQAKNGGFNGTRLYYARRGEWIELGGGARTRNAEPRDDREDDPDLALGPEDAARTGVKHRRRMVTSVPLLSGDQADRFAVVLSEKRPDFDAVRTPFGELLDDDSAGVADRLASQLTYGEDAAFLDRRERTDYPYTPSRPVTIRRVSIWKEGVLAPGHAWDTSRVNTDTPEPGAPEAGAEEPEKKPEEKPAETPAEKPGETPPPPKDGGDGK